MKMTLARIFRELTSRDREDGCATGQPQGVGAEAYLSSTSQGPTPEDAREDAHIRGRSRPFMIYAGYFYFNVFSFLFPLPMFFFNRILSLHFQSRFPPEQGHYTLTKIKQMKKRCTMI